MIIYRFITYGYYQDKQIPANCQACNQPLLEEISETVLFPKDSDKSIRNYCCTPCKNSFLQDNPNMPVYAVRGKI
jgi:hypothetical protein